VTASRRPSVWIAILASFAFAAASWAATEPVEPSGPSLPWKRGVPAAPIGDDLAEIDLTEGHVYLDQAGTRQFLELTQNPVGGSEIAVVAPASDAEQWFLVFEWDAIGYVEDDEKDALDADAMIASIREGTAAGNEERTRRGWPTMEIVGWHEPPHYDAATHHLTWAIVGASQGQKTVNKMVKLLGRRGVMSVTLVASPEEIGAASASADALLARHRFRPGNTYAEYLPGKDSVAEIGLKGLILGGAGAALIKSGLLGKLWKFIAVGVVALGGGIARLFGRKKTAGIGPTAT
jgi:uncharacterized membrane-anchored protein